MPQKSIFISRVLSDDSPIRKIAVEHNIIDRSLISFSPISFDTPASDWIFFYSRNGVKYFFANSNFELFPYQYACMSTGTAEELSKYVLDIEYIGNGIPKDVALQLKKEINPEERVTFIRSVHSVDSVHYLLDHELKQSLAVYNNEIIEDIPTRTFDILIFTSPMNAEAWFSKNTYNGQPIVAIGPTTARKLSAYTHANTYTASTPSESGLAEILATLI